ncbi:MAG: hypothetical protein KAY21_10840 [Limnohabitans sp.]|nr:hypothetical protein [Limnohabitans sp.]
MTPEIKARLAGCKFRPVAWSDISQPGAPVVGWGIERMGPKERRYMPVAWEGKIHPFASKADASKTCKRLNAIAQEGGAQ